MSNEYWHATAEYRGVTHTYTDGGRYEKIVDGVPQLKHAGNEHIGFKLSSVPEVAASKSKAGAALGKLQGFAQGEQLSTTQSTHVFIYQINQEPDYEIDTIIGDFELLEEVRYTNPAETPVSISLRDIVEFPPRAIHDIGLLYLPYGPNIIDSWGDAVKAAINHTIKTREYPDDVSEWADVEQPDVDAYENPHRHP